MRACCDERVRPENLDDLLRDPLVGLVMASDGVDPADVRALFRARRAPRIEASPAAARQRAETLTQRGARHF